MTKIRIGKLLSLPVFLAYRRSDRTDQFELAGLPTNWPYFEFVLNLSGTELDLSSHRVTKFAFLSCVINIFLMPMYI